MSASAVIAFAAALIFAVVTYVGLTAYLRGRRCHREGFDFFEGGEYTWPDSTVDWGPPPPTVGADTEDWRA
jgi:hypothetical protein